MRPYRRGSPPGPPVPGILQARTLEWVAISFSNAWKSLSCTDSLRPHGLQPTRLLCPWDFPGKSTGVGCHYPLQTSLFQFSSVVSSSLCPHESQHARPPCPSPTNNFPLNWNWIFDFVVLDLFFFQFSVSQQILLIFAFSLVGNEGSNLDANFPRALPMSASPNSIDFAAKMCLESDHFIHCRH